MTGGHRIGVLGGTFDPPHLGHLWLATLAAEALGLDRVLFMPAAQPPHKIGRPMSPAQDRVAMVRLAIGDDPLFELCGIELEREGLSYTLDSIVELQERHRPPDQLVLLMAADSLEQIGTWHEPERLLGLVEWGVGPRPGHWPVNRASLVRQFGPAAARIHLIDGPALAVSSSEIRERVAAGRTIRYLVPRTVEDLIVDHGLYRGAAARSIDPG